MSSLNALLSRDNEIGKQIRTFLTYEKTHNHILTEDLNQILASTPNLRRVSTNLAWYNFRHIGFTRSTLDSFDVQALTTLAQHAGDNLVELFIHLRRPSVPKTPEIFYSFTALKYLQMTSSAVFIYEEPTVEKNAFPNLESLVCAMSNNSFLLLLSIMTCVLPSISHLCSVFNQTCLAVFRKSKEPASPPWKSVRVRSLSFDNTDRSWTLSSVDFYPASASLTFARI